MTNQLPEEQNLVGLSSEVTDFQVTPGGRLSVMVTLANRGAGEDYFELSVLALPSAWVSMPLPVMRLPAGQEAEFTLAINPPSGHPGRYPFAIRAVSQSSPDQQAVLNCTLMVAALQIQGRIDVLLESAHYAVAPGDSVSVALVLTNQGLVEDYLGLSVEGIPAGWISTPDASIHLAPGEEKQATLTIRPPRTPQSRAGRHPIKFLVTSRETPDELTVVSCRLTVGAFTDFRSELRPDVILADQPANVLIGNLGNFPEAFTVSWESAGEQLVFEVAQSDPAESEAPATFLPVESQRVSVPAGRSASLSFRARPRSPRWIGDDVRYPFTATVQASNRDMQTLGGEVMERGMIPVWVVPTAILVFLLCICIAASSLFITNFRPQTTTQVAIQTSAPTQDPILLTQTASANQTAAAITGQQDSDGDGLTDQEELDLGTNPNNPDTDGDVLLDGEEVKTYQTDPKRPDTDGDQLPDGSEVRQHGTDPLKADTDGDELSDGDEILRRSTNPKNPDTDADGLRDGEEVIRRNTDPLNPDTDRDALNDGQEVQTGTDPLKPDTDNDRLLDGQESLPCPHPLNPDSDGDGFIDGLDLNPCDPRNPFLTATAVAQITPTPPVLPTPLTPSPPVQTSAPPNFQGVLAFESNRDGDSEIYLLNSVGFAIFRLTISPGVDTQPAWSPDGSRIAFTSNRDGNNEIYVMNADGSGQINLTKSPFDERAPTWSPDGQWIAFSTNRDGNQEIYAMKADGSGAYNLTRHPADDYQPSWFTDMGVFVSTGEWIVFTSMRDGNQEIYLMNADGSSPRNLTNHPANDFYPAGELGGTNIVFTTDRDGNLEIYKMNNQGNGLTNLTRHPAPDQMPTWSADGGWVAFSTNRDGNWEIYIVGHNGGQPYNLTAHPAQDRFPAWR